MSILRISGKSGAILCALAAAALGAIPATARADIYVSQDPGATGAAIVSHFSMTGTPSDGDFITGLTNVTDMEISGDLLYVVSAGFDLNAGRVGVYDAATGAALNDSLITRLKFPAGLEISKGLLYVGVEGVSAGQGTVRTYNATTGALVNGSFITGLRYLPGLEISGSTLYVSRGSDQRVSTFNATTGALLNANFVTSIQIAKDVEVSGNTLYVADRAFGRVSTFNATTGALIKATFVTGIVPFGMDIFGGNLYVAGANDNRVAEYDLAGNVINSSLITALNYPYAIAVPEPSVCILAAAAGALLASRRSRKKVG
jgi:hypothetical protein